MLPTAESKSKQDYKVVTTSRVDMARSLMLDENSHRQMAETFQALADTTRSKIVYSLLWQELCTSDLAELLGISEPAVSQHLRILRELRIVKGHRKGKMVFYSLDDAHVRTMVSVGLSHIRDAGRQPQRINEVLGMMDDLSREAASRDIQNYEY